MTPVDLLSKQEWKRINSELPNMDVCNRIRLLPDADAAGFLDSCLDAATISNLMLSRAAYHDAANSGTNARYALGQAIGVRKYFLGRSKKDKDNDHVLADLRSRFYADYVALLLYTTVEHALKGTLALYGLKADTGDYLLERVLKAVGKSYELEKRRTPSSTFQVMYSALSILNESVNFREASDYRNDWVHNEPRKVESLLYSPRRQASVWENPDGSVGLTIQPDPPPDYLWDELIELLKAAMLDVEKFLEVCADEWERIYSQK